MFNKFVTSVLLGICCTLYVAAEEKDHIPVGTRLLSLAEDAAIQETRKQLSEQNVQEEEQLQSNLRIQKKLHAKQSFSGHYTSHPGAIKQIYSISPFGDSVELHDGSIWTIDRNQIYSIGNWYEGDAIVVSPNSFWYTPFQFCLTNQNTGESVEANLTYGPIYNGPYTLWIVAIDDYYNRVILCDGSVWDMSVFDSSLIRQWMVNDTVIIGINDGWLSSTRPNILINVNMLNYASGICSF